MTKDEALDLALEALEYKAHGPVSGEKDLTDRAITAIKQARSAPVQENSMIYKTFEQWKSGNVLEHGVPRTEHYSEDQLDLVEMGWNYGYDAGRAVEQALDKKAENARELGLDYEPVLKDNSNYRYDPPIAEPVAYLCENAVGHKYFRWKKPSSEFKPIALYTTPPAAQPAVPDAIIEAGESPEFRDGWNECRETMLQMLKARNV